MGCELRSREPTRYPVWRASAAGDVAPASRVSEGTRTPDRLDHNQELYQLSYAHRGWLESISGSAVSGAGVRLLRHVDGAKLAGGLGYGHGLRRRRGLLGERLLRLGCMHVLARDVPH